VNDLLRDAPPAASDPLDSAANARFPARPLAAVRELSAAARILSS